MINWLLVLTLLALNFFNLVSDGFISGVGIGALYVLLTEPEKITNANRVHSDP